MPAPNAKSAIQQIRNQKEQNNLVQAQKQYYDAQTAKVAQESANLETANAVQQFNLDVNKQEFADYLYNRQFDVRSGKKITKGYSGGINGLVEQFTDRGTTLQNITADGAKKGSEAVKKGAGTVGNFLKRTGKRIKDWYNKTEIERQDTGYDPFRRFSVK